MNDKFKACWKRVQQSKEAQAVTVTVRILYWSTKEVAWSSWKRMQERKEQPKLDDWETRAAEALNDQLKEVVSH